MPGKSEIQFPASAQCSMRAVPSKTNFLSLLQVTRLVSGLVLVAASSGLCSAQSFLVSNLGDNSIHRFSMSGQDLGVFAVAPSRPYGMAMDSAGNILVALPFVGKIEKYSPSGTDLGVFATTWTFNEHLEFDRAGNLYISTGSRDVLRSPPDGGFADIFASGFSFSTGLAFDSSGTLYVSDNGPDSTGQYPIRRFSPAGVDLGVFVRVPKNPLDLTMDAQDNLYTMDYGLVDVFSPAGIMLRSFQAIPLADPATAGGMVLDPSGTRLLVTESQISHVWIFSVTGAQLGEFDTAGLHNPYDIIYVPEPSALSLIAFVALPGVAFRARLRRGRLE